MATNQPDIHVRIISFPNHKTHEAVVPEPDGGYSVYIEERLSHEERLNHYLHAVRHIQNQDFEPGDVQRIETHTHEDSELCG